MLLYNLKLLEGCRIHPVCHISCLKKHLGKQVSPALALPYMTDDGIIKEEPLAILERKLVKRGSAYGRKIWGSIRCEERRSEMERKKERTEKKVRWKERKEELRGDQKQFERYWEADQVSISSIRRGSTLVGVVVGVILVVARPLSFSLASSSILSLNICRSNPEIYQLQVTKRVNGNG
ncbi:hypothetical protein LWI28_004247 [Acer negundo]|uniref:Uncharacterized protein n=1 Tax=Acer negundo TaxID=4023 RepID=A0AAD5IP19_ACENE|nr:hypothetical protein LWI28_004247 [Acer negundo]